MVYQDSGQRSLIESRDRHRHLYGGRLRGSLSAQVHRGHIPVDGVACSVAGHVFGSAAEGLKIGIYATFHPAPEPAVEEHAVHLIIPDTGVTFVVLVFQIETWCGELQPSDSLTDTEETILDAQFVPVGEAIQRLEQGFQFANEPAIEHLCGHSSLGSVWIYQGDPSKGDRLVERTLAIEGETWS